MESRNLLPPPYQSSSPAPYTSVENPYPTALPAFDTPRKYSRRLRQIAQQRSSSRGIYLTLRIPTNPHKTYKIEVLSASTDGSSSSTYSSSSASSSEQFEEIPNEKTPLVAGLSAGIPLVEDIEAATFITSRRSKRSRLSRRSKSGKKELSWLGFISLLICIFMMVGSAAVFIAWATGFAHGKMAEFAKFKIGSGDVAVVPVPTSASNGAFGGVGGFMQSDKKVVERRSRVWKRASEGDVENIDLLFA